MATIYVIKYDGDKYYIGESKRMGEHVLGKGSVITKDKSIKFIEQFVKEDAQDENKYTKQYMFKYGIDNVRGGSFCSETLSPETIAMLEKEKATALNTCYQCNQLGHFANNCPLKCPFCHGPHLGKDCELICNYCGDKGHMIDDCPCKETIVKAFPVKISYKCDYCDNTFDTTKGKNYHMSQYCKIKKQQDSDSQSNSVMNTITHSITKAVMESLKPLSYKCDNCDKEFDTDKGKIFHMKRWCKGKPTRETKNKVIKFECEYCGRVCKTQAGLDKHIEEYCEEVER